MRYLGAHITKDFVSVISLVTLLSGFAGQGKGNWRDEEYWEAP